MKAMVLSQPRQPLEFKEIPLPTIAPDQVLLKVKTCAVCRTDLHIADGELANPKLPLVLGHQIVGEVVQLGKQVSNLKIKDRVGVPWLGWTCGNCKYCKQGKENLCDNAKFTGYTLDGGFAEYCAANAEYCFPIPKQFSDDEVAPFLCAGLIGFRCLQAATATPETKSLGIYGFGSAAHLVIQIAKHNGQEVYAFTRPGDEKGQNFARSLGAIWAGDSNQIPPEQLDAAIIFAPAGELVPQALKCTAKSGKVICGGIHMSDIPSFPYESLWEERSISSVANLTREDGKTFFEIAPKIPLKSHVATFPLSSANEALEALRVGKKVGSIVLIP